MSVAKDFEKVIYENECAFNAAVSYERRAVDGLIALKIVSVITPEEAFNIFHRLQIKTYESIADIANAISFMLEDIKEADITPEELSSLLIRIVALLTDMSTHKIKDSHLITGESD
jgi:hypothetical protein